MYSIQDHNGNCMKLHLPPAATKGKWLTTGMPISVQGKRVKQQFGKHSEFSATEITFIEPTSTTDGSTAGPRGLTVGASSLAAGEAFVGTAEPALPALFMILDVCGQGAATSAAVRE
jgi:hypothetical protein